MLNEVILLVEVLIDHAMHEILRVDNGNESNQNHQESNLANLLLQVLHLLRSSDVHRDTLGDASFRLCIPSKLA